MSHLLQGGDWHAFQFLVRIHHNR